MTRRTTIAAGVALVLCSATATALTQAQPADPQPEAADEAKDPAPDPAEQASSGDTGDESAAEAEAKADGADERDTKPPKKAPRKKASKKKAPKKPAEKKKAEKKPADEKKADDGEADAVEEKAADAEAHEDAEGAEAEEALGHHLPTCPPSLPPHPMLGPEPEAVLAGEQHHHTPIVDHVFNERCVRLIVSPAARATFGSTFIAYPVDRYGNELEPRPTFGPELRISARFETGAELDPLFLRLEYEHDLITNFIAPEVELAGQEGAFAYTEPLNHELRKGYALLAFGQYAQLSVGWQTSHWGMGLLANDGDHGWEPGSARIADPHSGDRPLRGSISTGPHTDLGFFAAVGGDLLNADFLADDDVLLEGDHGGQVIGALMLGRGKPHNVGAYAVYRVQENEEGRQTRVGAVDLAGMVTVDAAPTVIATFEAESALIFGETELGPTVDFPVHDVLQLGAAVRANLDAGIVGTVIDFVYASGDQNLDDDAQNGFKADPNFEVGMMLFRQVLADQSARSAFTAGDPTLVGVASEDLDRLPTRGSVTNTAALFPRLRVRPVDGLEIYSGPLFAWTVVPIADPLNTRVAGGQPRNHLNGEGGLHLGTEVDFGVRYRALFWGAEVTAGGELGILKPGSALVGAGAVPLDAVHGGRLMIDIRL